MYLQRDGFIQNEGENITPAGYLLFAVENDDIHLADRLLAQGTDPNAEAWHQDWGCEISPLRLASGRRRHELAKRLVQAGGEITADCLFDAVCEGDAFMVNWVLADSAAQFHGVVNELGSKVLHLAIDFCAGDDWTHEGVSHETIQERRAVLKSLLVARVAYLDHRDQGGQTPLDLLPEGQLRDELRAEGYID